MIEDGVNVIGDTLHVDDHIEHQLGEVSVRSMQVGGHLEQPRVLQSVGPDGLVGHERLDQQHRVCVVGLAGQCRAVDLRPIQGHIIVECVEPTQSTLTSVLVGRRRQRHLLGGHAQIIVGLVRTVLRHHLHRHAGLRTARHLVWRRLKVRSHWPRMCSTYLGVVGVEGAGDIGAVFGVAEHRTFR